MQNLIPEVLVTRTSVDLQEIHDAINFLMKRWTVNRRQGHTEASDAHRCDAAVASSETTSVRCKLASVKSTDAAKLHRLGRVRKRPASGRTASTPMIPPVVTAPGDNRVTTVHCAPASNRRKSLAEGGFEPPRGITPHRILSPVRLPIPPPGRTYRAGSTPQFTPAERTSGYQRRARAGS